MNKEFFISAKQELETLSNTSLTDKTSKLLDGWKDRVIPYLSGAYQVRLKKVEIIKDNSLDFPLDFPSEYCLSINEFEKKKALTLLDDMIFKFSCNMTNKEEYEALKLLRAREENLDFNLELANMICGDIPSLFPYKSSFYLTSFFQQLGHDFTHNGSTRRYWVEDRLSELNIKELHTLISKGLFNKKYFKNLDISLSIYENYKDINTIFEGCIKEFKEFIKESITMNESFDLSSVLDLNINVELLFATKAETEDEYLNKLIEEAKDRFFNPNDKHIALEKLWDAFERLKTYFDLEKKQSADKLSMLISQNFEKDFIDEEFKRLTTIGNSYQIRHHERGKKELTKTHINYFFFRMLTLIDLCLTLLEEKMSEALFN